MALPHIENKGDEGPIWGIQYCLGGEMPMGEFISGHLGRCFWGQGGLLSPHKSEKQEPQNKRV